MKNKLKSDVAARLKEFTTFALANLEQVEAADYAGDIDAYLGSVMEEFVVYMPYNDNAQEEEV